MVSMYLGRIHDYNEMPEGTPTLGKEPTSWCGRLVSGTLAVGACALRFWNYSRWTDGLGSIAAGFCSLTSFTWGVESKAMPKITQVALTALGIGTFFAASQVATRTETEKWHPFLMDTGMALLGANLSVMGRLMLRDGPEDDGIQQKIPHFVLIPEHIAGSMKAVFATVALSLSLTEENAFIQEFGSLVSGFYFFQIAAEFLAVLLHQKSSERDSSHPCVSRLQTLLEGLGTVAIPLSLVPWKVSSWIPAAIHGGASSFLDKNAKMRLKVGVLYGLEELKGVWQVATSVFSVGGMIGLSAWRFLASDESSERIASISTCTGFLLSYSVSKWVDHHWNPNQRNAFYDWAMKTIWIAPRILGMTPMFLYFISTRQKIKENEGFLHEAAILISSGMYGLLIGREIYIMSSHRIGTPLLKMPYMLFFKGAEATYQNFSS